MGLHDLLEHTTYYAILPHKAKRTLSPDVSEAGINYTLSYNVITI